MPMKGTPTYKKAVLDWAKKNNAAITKADGVLEIFIQHPEVPGQRYIPSAFATLGDYRAKPIEENWKDLWDRIKADDWDEMLDDETTIGKGKIPGWYGDDDIVYASEADKVVLKEDNLLWREIDRDNAVHMRAVERGEITPSSAPSPPPPPTSSPKVTAHSVSHGMKPGEGNRLVVSVDVGGKEVLLYRSSKGTSGKTAGKFYPFMGEGVGGWFIKGTAADMEKGYGVPEIKQAMDQMNSRFTPGTPDDEVLRVLESSGSKAEPMTRRLSEQKLGKTVFRDWAHETTRPEDAIRRANQLYGTAQTEANTMAKIPSWLDDELGRLTTEADKKGLTAKIIEGSRSRLTAGQIAQRLKIDKNVVQAVRAKHGIPSMDDAVEFEKWLSTQSPATPAVTGKADEIKVVGGTPVAGKPRMGGRTPKPKGMPPGEFLKIAAEADPVWPQLLELTGGDADAARTLRKGLTETEYNELLASVNKRTVANVAPKATKKASKKLSPSAVPEPPAAWEQFQNNRNATPGAMPGLHAKGMMDYGVDVPEASTMEDILRAEAGGQRRLPPGANRPMLGPGQIGMEAVDAASTAGFVSEAMGEGGRKYVKNTASKAKGRWEAVRQRGPQKLLNAAPARKLLESGMKADPYGYGLAPKGGAGAAAAALDDPYSYSLAPKAANAAGKVGLASKLLRGAAVGGSVLFLIDLLKQALVDNPREKVIETAQGMRGMQESLAMTAEDDRQTALFQQLMQEGGRESFMRNVSNHYANILTPADQMALRQTAIPFNPGLTDLYGVNA